MKFVSRRSTTWYFPQESVTASWKMAPRVTLAWLAALLDPFAAPFWWIPGWEWLATCVLGVLTGILTDSHAYASSSCSTTMQLAWGIFAMSVAVGLCAVVSRCRATPADNFYVIAMSLWCSTALLLAALGQADESEMCAAVQALVQALVDSSLVACTMWKTITRCKSEQSKDTTLRVPLVVTPTLRLPIGGVSEGVSCASRDALYALVEAICAAQLPLCAANSART